MLQSSLTKMNAFGQVWNRYLENFFKKSFIVKISLNGVDSRLNTIKERIKTVDCTEEFIQNAQ